MSSKEHIHVTKDGQEIPINNLENDHLINIINWIKRRAEIGFVIGGGCPFDPESMWADLIQGNEAEEYLNLKIYEKEAKKRNLFEKN